MGFAPSHLFYLASLRCDERCTKCSHWKVRSHPQMVDVALVTDAVRTISSAKEFCIVGGEPLVYRARVLDILRRLADVPIRTTIVTNGVRCTPEFIDQIRGLNVHLVFSIDTLDEARWRWIRGTDSMQVVFANIEYVRRTLNAEQLSLQSVLAEETRKDVAAVGRWCSERRIYHSVQRYVQGGFEGSWTPVTAAASQTLVTIGSGRNERVTDDGPCMAADRNLSIMPDGSVYTCFQQDQIPSSTGPIGRLGEMPINEMLDSPYTKAILDRMRRCALPCKVLKCNQ